MATPAHLRPEAWNNPANNAKTTLVEFCQRMIGRSMNKGDILYAIEKYPEGYQAVVKLNCLGSQEFASEVCANTREAEQHAARAALEALQADVAETLSKKRGADSELGGPPMKVVKGADGREVAVLPEGGDIQDRARLREAVKQVIARDVEEGDIDYQQTDVEGGFTCTLKITCLPEPLGSKSWHGSVSPFMRDSMLEAAKQALDEILAVHGSSIDLTIVPDNDQKRDLKKEKEKNAKDKKANQKGGMPGMPTAAEFVAMKGGKGKGVGLKGKGKGNEALWTHRWETINGVMAEMMSWGNMEWQEFEGASAMAAMQGYSKAAFLGTFTGKGQSKGYGKIQPRKG